MRHPFGDLITQFLHRKRGLSQARLAAGIGQPPNVISLMGGGKRLTGSQARERVVAIIDWLHREAVLTTLEEANALLTAAGMTGLDASNPGEAALLLALSAPAAPSRTPMITGNRRTNLPVQLTSFVGREQQLARLIQLLGSNRLVTLTGTGGCGKTRLALEAASQMLGNFADGVWLVDFAPLPDPSLVPNTVLTAIGVCEEPGSTPLDTLVNALQSKSMLLVLDNCEHLITACAVLAERLLQACPYLHILATSRESLDIPGEVPYQVPSLALPDPQVLTSITALEQNESVRLFIDRATLVQPTFHLTPQNAAIVVQICEYLDGIPLAIELAAARLKAFTVEQIAARLEDRFHLLTGGSRTALPRYQTLRASIDWSYDLLSEAERAVLRRFAVFSGGWTLEAAEAVCADATGSPPVASAHVMDILAQLVNKSLAIVEEQEITPRYSLLETIREYLIEKLVEANEAEIVRRRHFTFFLTQSEKPLAHVDKLNWFEAEYDNLRAALIWAKDSDPTASLRLANQLSGFWYVRGYWNEGRHWLTKTLARVTDAPIEERAKALQSMGVLASFSGDYERGIELLEESLALAPQFGDKELIMGLLGQIATNIGLIQGDYERAAQLEAESLLLAREVGSATGIAYAYRQQGMLAYSQQQYTIARARLKEALAIDRNLQNQQGIGHDLALLGLVALKQGDTTGARTYLTESLTIRQELGYKSGIAVCLEGFAALAIAQGQARRAVRLLATAQTLRDTIGDTRPFIFERIEFEQNLVAAHRHLSNSAFETAWAEGHAMTTEQAIAYALEETPADDISAGTQNAPVPAEKHG